MKYYVAAHTRMQSDMLPPYTVPRDAQNIWQPAVLSMQNGQFILHFKDGSQQVVAPQYSITQIKKRGKQVALNAQYRTKHDFDIFEVPQGNGVSDYIYVNTEIPSSVADPTIEERFYYGTEIGQTNYKGIGELLKSMFTSRKSIYDDLAGKIGNVKQV